jgi:hypothetical protein
VLGAPGGAVLSLPMKMARTWHAVPVVNEKTVADLRLCWWAILGLNQ